MVVFGGYVAVRMVGYLPVRQNVNQDAVLVVAPLLLTQHVVLVVAPSLLTQHVVLAVASPPQAHAAVAA